LELTYKSRSVNCWWRH